MLKGISKGRATITLSTSDSRNARFSVVVSNDLSVSNFDPDVYRANKLLDTSIPMGNVMRHTLSSNTPCGIYVPALQSSGFETWKTAWDVFTTTFESIDNPANLTDFVVKNKDIYSAIVLNMLEVSTNYGVVDSCEAIIKDAKSFVSEINMLLKVEYDIDSSDFDWEHLSDSEQKLIKDTCEKFYKEHYQVDVQSINKVFDKIGNVLSVANNMESYLEKISSAIAMTNMSESLKTVVRTMYQRCPSSNVYLKLALADCEQIIDSSSGELIAKLFTDEISSVGVDAAKYLVGELWKEVKSVLNAKFPYLDIILAGYKTGKFLSDMLFSTDSTIEQYCVMLAVLDIENLMADVFKYMEQQYLKSGSKDAASAYLSSIDLSFSSRDQDCLSAYDFVDILDDALVNRIGSLFDQTGANQREGIKNSISSIQKSYDVGYESALTGWINYLEEDYPGSGLEEKFQSLQTDSYNRILKKKYVAACPVDLYVYDQSNNLVANVIDGKPYCNGNITVAVNGDKKELYFYDDKEYRIEYVGNDEGTMDVTVSEYDETESVLRDVYFYDVPLEEGKAYISNVDGKTLGETTYLLTSDSSNNLNPDLDTYHTEQPKRKVNINSGSLIINNEMFVSTDAYPGEQLNIYAYVPEGYTFSGWKSNAGSDIFADPNACATTVCVPDENITVTATYEKAKYSITFDANGGSGEMKNLPVSNGDTYTLPDCTFTPPSDDLEFDSWAIGSINGTKVAANGNYKFTAETTVYALWKKKGNVNLSVGGGGGGVIPDTPSVSVTESENGSISMSPSRPGKGETVTITVTPKDGYELSTLKVKDSSGKEISTTRTEDGKYTFTMPSGKVIITPEFTKTSAQQPVISFTDVSSNAYYSNAVTWAVAQGITNGTTETTFSPDKSCTRAQMVTFLWRAAGSPAPSNKTNPFKDMTVGTYYYDAVLWAVEHGITTGTTDTTFSPDNIVTRGQTVTFMYRNAGSPKVDTVSPFADVTSNAYYADAVVWAASNDITKGTTGTTFSPNESCNRAQIVTFLYRKEINADS